MRDGAGHFAATAEVTAVPGILPPAPEITAVTFARGQKAVLGGSLAAGAAAITLAVGFGPLDAGAADASNPDVGALSPTSGSPSSAPSLGPVASPNISHHPVARPRSHTSAV